MLSKQLKQLTLAQKALSLDNEASNRFDILLFPCLLVHPFARQVLVHDLGGRRPRVRLERCSQKWRDAWRDKGSMLKLILPYQLLANYGILIYNRLGHKLFLQQYFY